jgi:ATP-grasp domain
VTSTADAQLAGVELEAGLRALRETGVDLWWFARSMFLCADCDVAAPWLRFQPSGDLAQPPGPTVGPSAVFGFRVDTAMRTWAAGRGSRIAMPAPELSLRVGAKTRLPTLARAAGVAVPRSVMRTAVRGGDADGMWRELAAPRAVAQLAENDLTGAGTRRIGSVHELAVCLREWEGRDVKLAEYLDGLPITVSGVVTGGGVVVSGMSYQIVGRPELTPLWGAHCGNQLLDDARLPSGAGAAARETCWRIGGELARAGFRGMFGIDALVADEVVVLEINPRIQSVTSLLSMAELAAGILPSPLLHALAFLADPPPATAASGDIPPFGQLVASARTAGKVSALPTAGVHRLPAARVGRTAARRPALGSLPPGQALVWPMADVGAYVEPADRLYVMQTPGPVVDVARGTFTEPARRWLQQLSRQVRIEGVAA